MARYEGMDEILQRVRQQLQEPGTAHEELPPPPLHGVGATLTAEAHQFAHVIEAAASLQSQAEAFAELVPADYLATLTDDRQQRLLAALGTVLHELWGIEDRLQHTPSRER